MLYSLEKEICKRYQAKFNEQLSDCDQIPQ